jgi:hypothetical protein
MPESCSAAAKATILTERTPCWAYPSPMTVGDCGLHDKDAGIDPKSLATASTEPFEDVRAMFTDMPLFFALLTYRYSLTIFD